MYRNGRLISLPTWFGIEKKTPKRKLSNNKDPNIRLLEQDLSEKIGMNIEIKNRKNNKGTITFSYNELEQLNRIIELIKSNY